MSKTKKPTNHTQHTKSHPKSYTKILIILATLLLIPCLLPWFFPYDYYRYVKCGREPVKVVSRGFSNETANYITSHDSGYNDYGFFAIGYFCTEDEARSVGLKSLYGADGWFNSETTPRSQIRR